MKYWLLIIFGLCLRPLSGQQFHLIVLADTADPVLRPAVLVNVDRLRNQSRRLAAELDMAWCVTQYMADGLRFARADSLLASLGFGPDDVVLFHYSGHGVNSGISHWPRFLLEDSGNQADLLYFNAVLRQKGPRLLLSLADCCNTGGSRFRPKAVSAAAGPEWVELPTDTAGLAVLFRESAGNLVCSGSRAGQASYYEDHLGGYFTLAFCYALSRAGGGAPAWDSLLADVAAMTTQMTREMGREQEPQFLWLPGLPPAAAAAPVRYHTVREGETCRHLAHTYGVSVADLRAWNGLSADTIRVGMRLRILSGRPWPCTTVNRSE